MEKEILIKRNYGEPLKVLAGVMPLLITGIFLTFEPKYEGRTITRIVGILNILFWGGGGLYVIYHFFKDKTGLKILKDGIVNNSNKNLKSDLIAWKDIQGFDISQDEKVEIIIIQLKNQEQYITAFPKKGIQKKLNKNQEQYGSPAIIETDRLYLNMVSVLELLNTELKKHQ